MTDDVGMRLRVELPGGTAVFTSRGGGVSGGPYESLNLGLWTGDDPARVRANRERVRAGLGLERLAQGHQVHGAAVAVDSTGVDDSDGQVVTRPGVGATVLVADCLPVALVAPRAVAMLHAGWRGLAGGVLENGVTALRDLDAGPIAAAIGPGIGPCCYEVGDEVRSVFGTTGRTLDLRAAARERLDAAGVTRVEDIGMCTSCHPELFFSHRRDDGVTGRQAGVAWRS